MYEFNKVFNPEQENEFKHIYFKKDQEELLGLIKRKNNDKKKSLKEELYIKVQQMMKENADLLKEQEIMKKEIQGIYTKIEKNSKIGKISN